jgi:hypothetical protein
MLDFCCGRWTGGIRSTKERVMSVRNRRLAVAAITAATAIAVPTAALASGSGTSSGKPAPSAAASNPAAAKSAAAKSGAAGGSAAAKSGAAGGSAAASKSAARQSASDSTAMSAMVAALATRLGVSHSAAQHALNQLEGLGRAGIDPASPAFAMIAHDLGVSPTQLADALRAAKQSVAG